MAERCWLTRSTGRLPSSARRDSASRCEATKPICSLSASTLERRGGADSQMDSSLSTPTRATSPGIFHFLARQMPRTWLDTSSFAAKTPQGLGRPSIHAFSRLSHPCTSATLSDLNSRQS